MILSTIVLFNDVDLVQYYFLITGLILIAGPFGCTRLLKTISIH